MQQKYGVIERLQQFYWSYRRNQTIERTYTKGDKSRTYQIQKKYTLQEIYHLVVNVIKSHGYEYQLTEDSIYIKMPDVICTNVYGNTQDITGMIIQIKVKTGIYINGRRFSFTPEQWYSKYNHSHLSCFENNFENFCFGTVINVSAYMNDYREGIFHEKLDWLLHYMPVYLSQESTHTNPYKEISRVRFPGMSNSNLTFRSNHLDYLDHIMLKYNQHNITVELKESINQILIEQGYGVFIDKNTKQEFTGLNVNYKPDYYDLQENPFKFRGKIIEVKLNDSKTKIEDYQQAASEKIKQQIINKYESTLNSAEFISACKSRTECEIINQ